LAGKYVGVYLTKNSFRVVEITIDSKRFKITKVVSESIDNFDSFSQVAEQIYVVLRKNKIKTRTIVLALSGDYFNFNLIGLPEMPENEYRTAIGYKLGVNVENENESGVIYNFYKVPLEGISSKLYFNVVSAKTNFIKELVSAFKKQHIKINEILPYFCALKNVLFDYSKRKTCVLVDSNYKKTTILLIKAGVPVFAREMDFGLENVVDIFSGVIIHDNQRFEITKQLSKKLLYDYGIPFDDFELYSSKSGLPANEILAMIRPALEKISAEIIRTIEFYKDLTGDKTDFNNAFVTGVYSLIPNFSNYISQEINFPVKNLELPKQISISEDIKEPISIYMIPFGAVVSTKNFMSLLPDEYKKPIVAFWHIFGNVYVFTPVYFVFLVLLYYSLLLYKGQIVKEHDYLKAEAKKINALTFENEDVKILNSFTTKYGNINKNVLPNNLLEILTRYTPQSIFYKKINYFSAQNELILRGIMLKKMGSKGLLADFIKGLNDIDVFKSIELLSLRDSTEYSEPVLEFEIKCTLK